jgi:hypothetical protein
MKKNLFLSAVLLSLLMNCSLKSSDTEVVGVFDLLVASKWTKTENFEDLDQNGVFVKFGEDCEEDDCLTFKPDNFFSTHPGTELCDSLDLVYLVQDSLVWALEGNDQYLVFDYPFDEVKYKINTCDEHQLVLSLWDQDAPSVVKYKLILSR